MASLVKATVDDLYDIAAIHKCAFSKSHFTSFFSEELLVKYYGLFIDNGSEIWLKKDYEKKTIGFVVFGSKLNERISQFKSEHRVGIILTALRNPILSIQKVINKTYNLLFSTQSSYQEAEVVILSISVARKRTGVGASMLSFVSEYNKELGASVVGLYVRADNVASVNFYLSSGYKIIVFTSDLYYMERKA